MNRRLSPTGDRGLGPDPGNVCPHILATTSGTTIRKRLRRGSTNAMIAVRVACVIAITGALLAGCGSSSMQDSEGRAFVRGSSTCDLLNEESVPSDNPDIDLITGVYRCRDEMSDARVTGIVDFTLDPYYIHYATQPQTGRFEASSVLTTDEGNGSWRGNGFGVDVWRDEGLSTVWHTEFIGEGEYAGLVYRAWGSQKPDSDAYEVVGYIERTE